MPDVTMCKDTRCPSRLSCYRFVAYPAEYDQPWFITSPRYHTEDRCPYYIKANCCHTSMTQWGPGDYEGHANECLFCGKDYKWEQGAWVEKPIGTL